MREYETRAMLPGRRHGCQHPPLLALSNFLRPLRTAARWLSQLITIGLLALSAAAQDAGQASAKHIIVLYDSSWSVAQKPQTMQRANRYLDRILFGNPMSVPISENDHLQEPIEHHGLGFPLWTPGDCISFFRFGMEQHDLEEKLRQSPSEQFWRDWQVALIHESLPRSGCPADSKHAQESVNQFLSSPANAYPLTLSYYALPTLATQIPNIVANRTLVVWVSDFFSNSTDLQALDEPLVQKHLGSRADILRRAIIQFHQLFTGDDSLLQLSVGSRGIKIEVLELRPVELPQIRFSSSLVNAEETHSGWELKLPTLEVSSLEPSKAAAFMLNRADLVVSDRSSNVGPVVQPVPDIKTFRYGTTWKVSKILVPGRTTLGRERRPNIRLQISLVYQPQNSFGFRFPLLVQTQEIPIEPTRLSFLPPPEEEHRRQLLIAAGVTIVSICALLYLLRRPRCTHTVDWNTDEYFTINGISYPLITWRAARISVLVRFHNPLHLSLRGVNPRLKIVSLPTGSYAPKVSLRAGAEEVVGDVLRLQSLRAGNCAEAALVLDFLRVSEPPEPVGPLRVDLALYLGGADSQRESLSFVVGPPEGSFWLGMDPGTSGACIAGGDTIHELDTIPLEEAAVGEDRFIAPSLIYACEKESERDDREAIRVPVDGKEVAFWVGRKVYREQSLLPPERVFRSAKRLLGYQNPRRVSCDYLTPQQIELRGADAVRALATYLVGQAESYFRSKTTSGRQAKLNKAVVAVPNSFTPAKIRQMKDCCLISPIQRVEHIYEAEAVLMFYLWRESHLEGGAEQPVRSLADTAALRESNGEYVLVCDFGGGSVNFTYARVTKRADKTLLVEVLQRLGFALGGDKFDFEIARALWDRLSRDRSYQSKDPFKKKLSPEDRQLRALVWKEAEHLKTSLAGSKPNDSMRLSNDEFTNALMREPIRAEDLIGAQGIRDVFDQLARGVSELVDLCQGKSEGSKSWGGLHTLIFSGRSTRFPKVQEVISERLAELFSTISLVTVRLGAHAKTCVARGAAYWALQRDRIRVVRYQAFAHYGVRQSRSGQFKDFRFIPIIQPGKPFENGKCTGEQRNLTFEYDDRLIFYQVMGASPSEILKNPEKNYARYSMLAKCSINPNAPVQKIAITLDAKDDGFELHVFQGNQELLEEGRYGIQDILEEGDESSAWLLQ